MNWTIGEDRFRLLLVLGGFFADRDGGDVGHFREKNFVHIGHNDEKMLMATTLNC